jgi:hypothetical protein
MTDMLTNPLLYNYSFTYLACLTYVFKEDIFIGSNLRSVLVIILYSYHPGLPLSYQFKLHSPLFILLPPKSFRVVIPLNIL